MSRALSTLRVAIKGLQYNQVALLCVSIPAESDALAIS